MGREGYIPNMPSIVVIKGQKHRMYEKQDVLAGVLVVAISETVVARNRVPYIYMTLDIHPGDRTFGIVWNGVLEQIKDIKVGDYINCIGKKSDNVNTFNVFSIEKLSEMSQLEPLEPEIGPVGSKGPVEEYNEPEVQEVTRPVE